MRLPVLAITAILGLTLSAAIAYGQNLDTSNEGAFTASLAEMYNSLPADNQLAFEAYYTYLLGGGKSLPRFSKLKGLKQMEAMYPIIPEMEKKRGISFHNVTATDIIAFGQKHLGDEINKKIAAAENEAIKGRLRRQLEIINQATLTKEDMEEYRTLQH